MKSVERTELPSTLDSLNSIADSSSFQFTYQIVTETSETAPKISPTLEPAISEPVALESTETRVFEPAGVFLAAIVGTLGLISLLKGAIPLAALCLPLAALGIVCSHKHFDRE